MPSPSRTLAPTPEPGVLPTTTLRTSQRPVDFNEKAAEDEVTSKKYLGRRAFQRLRVKPFRGIVNDLRARLPYYASDWTDAWNYRVVPATAFTFCTKCAFPRAV